MHMLYCFVNDIHVDYADLIWEGFHYSLEHPTTLILYPRFTKLIVSHYMTAFLDISRRAHDKYHNFKDDEMVKSIFNSGKNKARVGLKIPSWIITDEMKLTKNYQTYATVRARSNMESPEVEITIVQPVNVIEEEEESADDDHEFRRKEKGKEVEETRNTPSLITIRSPRIHSTLISSDIEKLQELTKTNPKPSSSTPSSYSSKSKLSVHINSFLCSNLILDVSNATRVSLMSYKDATDICLNI
uniref:Uncharacterized protein n=1 Tax=Tanacetum cinerariifolium TaxID=118510 RepID=A0A699KPA5_TANCI|nr:hypothetical protein [Tanacetum cinerariifolium]